MICPTCGQYRSKAYWRNSQWKSHNPETNWYKRCRYCDNEMDLMYYDSQPDVQDSNPPAAPPPPHNFIEDKCFLELSSWWQPVGFPCAHFSKFVDAWVVNMGRPLRKFLSRFGAVQSIESFPVHYQCEFLQRSYFDASNKVYGLVLDLLCGGPKSWNDETKGDVITYVIQKHKTAEG